MNRLKLKRLFLFGMLLFCLLSCAWMEEQKVEQKPMPDSLIGLISSQDYQEGWRPLFNKKNLEGWKGFLTPGFPPGWYVEDSLLVTRGDSLIHPVDMITINQYEDFELSLEWAISWQGNSGIFYHSMENSWAAWVMGPEYALVDQSNLDEMEAIYRTGSCYGVYPPTVDCVAPQSAFNLSRIKVEKGHVEHWLNGQKVVDYHLWSDEWYEKVAQSKWKDYPQYGKTYRGAIGLQGHGQEVKFKNLKIRELTHRGQAFSELVDDWQEFGEGVWEVKEDHINGEGLHNGIIGYAPDFNPENNYTIRFQYYLESIDTLMFGLFDADGKEQLIIDPSRAQKEFILEPHELMIPLSGSPNTSQNKWNDVYIMHKNSRILVWLNDVLIVEQKITRLSGDLNHMTFFYGGNSECKLSLQKGFLHQFE